MRSSPTCRNRLCSCCRLARLLAAGIALACTVLPLAAIDPARTMSQYVREKWGTEQGFPNGPVYAIAQGQDGYLWIGTERGLIRFDGFNFRFVDNAGTEPVNHVLGLLTDREGSLWVRLRRPTLLRYRNGLFHDPLENLTGQRPTTAAIALDKDSGILLWALSGEPSVMVLRNGKFETLAAPANFSRSPVLAMAQTSDGDVWVGTRDAGLYRLHGSQTIKIRAGLPDPKVNALFATANNQLWVGTDGGVVRWDGARLTSDGVPRALNGVQALALTEDRDANLWVGTNSHGLFRVNARGAVSLEHSSDLNDAVTAVFEDREGNLWAGRAGVLERLRDSAFTSYSQSEGIPSDGNIPLFVDAQERTWFGPARGGLQWMKDGKHEAVNAAGLDRDVVYSIAGRAGELWAGRQNGGLTHLQQDGSSWRARTYTQKDGLAQDSVYAVYPARDGTIWAGTLSGGVSHLVDGRFENYNVESGLASNTITSIVESLDGTLWFATPAGVSARSGGRWQSYGTKAGLPSNDITCLLEDATGVLWAGTSAGISYRSGGRFLVPAAVPSSLREPILGIAEDRYGSLWVATANHVLRVNRERLLQGALAAGDLREFSLADGLRGVEGVRRYRSVVKDGEGRIWFSLNRGISVVDPGRLRGNAAPAIPQIQSVSVDGVPVRLPGALHFPGGHKRITIGYTGLSLSVPDRVRFRYQLPGVDPGWSEPVATREVSYTNIAPGAYRFRLLASNPDGIWSGDEASIAFEVDPLFWQTWWFRTASVVAFAGVILGIYWLRLHRLTRRLNLRFEERLAERNRIARELHDTLLQGFLSASMQVHVAADSLPAESQAKRTLTRALQLMGQVIEEGRNAVRGLRSSYSASLDLEHSFSKIQDELALSKAGDAPVNFRVIIEGQQRPLNPLLRDEVYRIGREALINAFRHSRAGKVEVEMKYSPGQLRILVRDDGCGIDPATLQSGRDGHWGMSGMRERAERIGARLKVWSSTTTGTEVELCVPSHVAFQDHRRSVFTWFSLQFRRGAAKALPADRKGRAT